MGKRTIQKIKRELSLTSGHVKFKELHSTEKKKLRPAKFRSAQVEELSSNITAPTVQTSKNAGN
jgi:hypothetical protein